MNKQNYLDLGATLWYNRDYQGAYNAYNQAIIIDSNYAEAYCGRAYALQDLGRYQEAVNDYSKAIEINPSYADAYLNRAIVFLILKNKKNAKTDALKAMNLSQNQNNQMSFMRAKRLLEELESNNDFRNKAEAEILYNQGNVAARMGMFENALLLYDRAITLDNSNPSFYNNRASTLKRLGRFQEALEQYESMIAKFPEYGKVYLCLASTYVEIQDYDSAVDSYQKFLTAYEQGKFIFNPVIGGTTRGLNYGKTILETTFLTSINYLSPSQAKMAMSAFNQAILNYTKQQKLYD